MNSLYSLATKQSNALQQDLAALERDTSSWTSARSSQLSSSLAALDRTIDDYDSMARREIVEAKREKAISRVARFRDDYASLRKQFDRVKQNATTQVAAHDRDQLLGSSTSSALGVPGYASHSQRLQNRSTGQTSDPYSANGSAMDASRPFVPNSPYVAPSTNESPFAASLHNNARTNRALDESGFLSSTSQTLDSYIQQGQAVLGNLANQEDMLKGTKRRLLSAANTLGLSRSTIQFIDRRTTGDFYILIGGAIFTFFCFWLILHYLG